MKTKKKWRTFERSQQRENLTVTVMTKLGDDLQMTTVTMPSGANNTWSAPNKGHRCPGSETGHAITKSLLRETALKMSMSIQAK